MAIRPATAGRFVLDASDGAGVAPVPPDASLPGAVAAPADRLDSGPSGMTDSATRARVSGYSRPGMVDSS
ncbi:MAG: hypothetical protein ACRDNT_27520 [Streptosporangiaceae bacterium]